MKATSIVFPGRSTFISVFESSQEDFLFQIPEMSVTAPNFFFVKLQSLQAYKWFQYIWSKINYYEYLYFCNFQKHILVFFLLLSYFHSPNFWLPPSNPNKTSCVLNYPRFFANLWVICCTLCFQQHMHSGHFSDAKSKVLHGRGFKHCFHLAVSFVGQSTLQLEKVSFIYYVSKHL